MSTAPPAGGFVLPHDAEDEVVERKGVGHPDTLADGIAELASIRYSEYCLREFGAVLHHNLDKVAVLGGRVAFGPTSGRYVRPLRIVFGGRASRSFAGTPIPVPEILITAARDQLQLASPGYDQTLVELRIETTDSSKFTHCFTPRTLEDLPGRCHRSWRWPGYAHPDRTPADCRRLLGEEYPTHEDCRRESATRQNSDRRAAASATLVANPSRVGSGFAVRTRMLICSACWWPLRPIRRDSASALSAYGFGVRVIEGSGQVVAAGEIDACDRQSELVGRCRLVR